jgi:hypothetical protein
VGHPSCSPDLVLNDFWLLLKIMAALKRRRFQDIKDIQRNVMMVLKDIYNRSFKNVFNSGSIVGLNA